MVILGYAVHSRYSQPYLLGVGMSNAVFGYQSTVVMCEWVSIKQISVSVVLCVWSDIEDDAAERLALSGLYSV